MNGLGLDSINPDCWDYAALNERRTRLTELLAAEYDIQKPADVQRLDVDLAYTFNRLGCDGAKYTQKEEVVFLAVKVALFVLICTRFCISIAQYYKQKKSTDIQSQPPEDKRSERSNSDWMQVLRKVDGLLLLLVGGILWYRFDLSGYFLNAKAWRPSLNIRSTDKLMISMVGGLTVLEGLKAFMPFPYPLFCLVGASVASAGYHLVSTAGHKKTP